MHWGRSRVMNKARKKELVVPDDTVTELKQLESRMQWFS
jgi:hypothetical protein